MIPPRHDVCRGASGDLGGIITGSCDEREDAIPEVISWPVTFGRDGTHDGHDFHPTSRPKTCHPHPGSGQTSEGVTVPSAAMS